MNSAGLLADAFGRVREAVRSAAEGLPPDDLNARLDDGANSIAWLLWHLARVQDDHIADAAGTEQVWLAQGWSDRFALPFEERATGYGHSAEEVAAVRVDSAEPLLGYYDAVHERTLEFVAGLNGHALDRIVDEGWSPPVTLGVRLVSVLADGLQHAGQAAFVRGSLQRV
ncbi:DinB family protein [Streptomyces sp. NBC_01433]|uniref:mycothiol transferase n=1 Tax=Streptomyces sp. NBC_01433 TaxID=2903864 RepID=UPI00225AD38E|nr:DinB family protein [Streptomyces sp. NBC_01433]MCX4680952.1 DinB family protein [Streptomyces sp. NBC_01433]